MGWVGGGVVPVYFLFHEPLKDSWTLIDVSRESKGVSITYGKIYGSKGKAPGQGWAGEGWGATLGVVFGGLLEALEI